MGGSLRTRPEPGKANAVREQRCPNCDFNVLATSGPHALIEHCLFMVGGSVVRCCRCEARYAWFRGRPIRLKVKEAKDSTPLIVGFAIVSGMLVCLLIAAWVLRRFHRWPF
jgi:hypothetical protein